MQIFRFITQNYKEILLSSAFLYSNVVIVKSLMLRKSYVKKLQEIKTTKIISMEEAVQISKISQSLKKQDKNYLIKVYPGTSSKKIFVTKKVRSNQLWLLEPSLSKMVNDVASLSSRCFIDTDKKSLKKLGIQQIWSNPTWKVKCKNHSKENLAQIKGFGEIIDHEIFNVEWRYYPMKEKGLFVTFLENAAYIFQFLFFENTEVPMLKNLKLSYNQNRAPFIKGPVIGHIIYMLDFLKDRPVLIEAKIQDSSIVAQTIAGSKEKLLSSINMKILGMNFSISFFVLTSYLSLRFLTPKLNRLTKKIKKQLKLFFNRQKIRSKEPLQFRSTIQSLNEKKLCIICYTNCRNTIIFNCRHMIMCDECKNAYQNHSCPLCKNEIQDHKILYEY